MATSVKRFNSTKSTDQDASELLMPTINNNAIDMPDGKGRNANMTISEKEIQEINEQESTSQGILEVVGLQQTVNIAVLFVKADLTVNCLYYMTIVIIVMSIVAQILLASLATGKIWIRKSIKQEKKKKKNLKNGDVYENSSLRRMQNRLRKLNVMTQLLVLFISILTITLLATSGMIGIRRRDDISPESIRPTQHLDQQVDLSL